MTAPSRRRPSERGSAAVLATVLLALLLVVTVLGAALAAAVVGQRRVETAADLGALAAATAVQHGASACAVAADVVRRNGGLVASCAVAGEVVTVRATRTVPSLLGRRLTVSSTARAGPSFGGPVGSRIHLEVGRTARVHD